MLTITRHAGNKLAESAGITPQESRQETYSESLLVTSNFAQGHLHNNLKHVLICPGTEWARFFY